MEGISKVRLFIDGEYICDIPYGGLREDLKEHYPNYPNAEKGGFALIWNYSSLPPGPHVIRVEAQNLKGGVIDFSSTINVHNLSGEVITQVNPNELLIRGVNLILGGEPKTYDLKLGWTGESQAFDIFTSTLNDILLKSIWHGNCSTAASMKRPSAFMLRFPGSKDKYNGVARALTEMGRHKEAGEILDRGLAKFPRSYALWVAKGN